MTSSIFDMLPPELRILPVLLAGMALVAGLVLWSAGIKVARGLVSTYLGLALAGVAMVRLPAMTGMAPVTCAIIGLVFGVMIGAMAFRFVQGIAVAAVIGVAAAGGYYAWQQHNGLLPAATQAADLQIALERLPEGGTPEAAIASGSVPAKSALEALPARAQMMADEVTHTLAGRWVEIPELVRRRMVVLGITAALAALIVALLFPRHTTWVVTAAAGAVMLLAGVLVLVQVYLPQYGHLLPARAVTRWGILAIVMLVGMLLQRKLFWKKPAEKQEKREPQAEGPGEAVLA